MTVSRRAFVAASAASLVAITPRSRAADNPAAAPGADRGLRPSYPSHDPELVERVVGRSHMDYDAVHELVTARPQLAKAAWDWGFGDWEAALGAASHMGRHDIAELLIAHGARPDLFTLAMLDQVDAVRAICEASPGIQSLAGPHGITLLSHAVNGKADRTAEYLRELGGADQGPVDLPIDQAAAAVYLGRYQPAGAPDVVFTIAFNDRRGTVTFQRDQRTPRFLLNQGDHVFNPGGAASVRLEFELQDDRARSLVIRDGDEVVRAVRLG